MFSSVSLSIAILNYVCMSFSVFLFSAFSFAFIPASSFLQRFFILLSFHLSFDDTYRNHLYNFSSDTRMMHDIHDNA